MSKRVYEFTGPKREEFLQHLRQGMRRGAASDIVFGTDNPNQRRKTRDYIAANSDFELAVMDAEIEATEHVEEALYQAAISGNVSAAKAWIDLKGGGVAKQPVGRPAKVPDDAPEALNADFFNVTPIDPRARREKKAQADADE